MVSLTPRQQEVLEFIRRFCRRRGYPPTVREISRHLGLAGPRGAAKHLQALENKGVLRRIQGISRGLELLQPLPSPLAAVPIVGRVPAGPPVPALEEREGELLLDPSLGGEGCFLLRVTGDSMSGDHIMPGDLALVRPCPTAVEGELVVAMVGEEATLKRFRLRGDKVMLEASNPRYPPLLLGEEDAPVSIVGRVEAVIRLLERGRPR